MKKLDFKAKNLLSLVVSISLLASFAGTSQAWGKSVEDKLKDRVDHVSKELKKKIDSFGEDVRSIQNYLENYSWKGVLQDEVTSGPETLSEIRLNGHRRVVVVDKGAPIHGEVKCSLDPKIASPLNVYRVVLGFARIGPQVAVGVTWGGSGQVSYPKFKLTAPTQPGFYEIRFRTADKFLESKALDAWYDENGREPDSSTTIGIVYVR